MTALSNPLMCSCTACKRQRHEALALGRHGGAAHGAPQPHDVFGGPQLQEPRLSSCHFK